MKGRKIWIVMSVLLVLAALPWGVDRARAQQKSKTMGSSQQTMPPMRSITAAQRKAAADRAAAAREAAGYKPGKGPLTEAVPGGTPDYFGIYPNWANSPLPVVDAAVTIADPTGTGATAEAIVSGGVITGIVVTNGGTGYTAPTVNITSASGSGATATATQAFGVVSAITMTAGGSGYAVTGGLRKFINGLPGLGAAGANNLGQYIPVAVPNKTAFANSDYYEIQLSDHAEQMHGDLVNPTKVRGYSQTNTTDPTVSAPHYLGPLILATKGTPVRVKFTNNLPGGTAGDLFIPVDTSVMGAGMGPTGAAYQQNRATLHLHGGLTPWISDGTPHQWTVPFGDVAATYQKGVSAQDVPDMPASGQGTMTFYYPNQQSSRLMFYHDHAYGITRLSVYAGEAAGYLLVDPTEESLINSGALPNLGGLYRYGVPLIIQDKTFVDSTTLPTQDPTWNWGTTPPTPHTGDLWFPHVYMPNQNPWDLMGVNAMGRWDYALWFWPPFTGLIAHDTVPNPYAGLPGEPPQIPGTPNPSLVPEAFMDTPIVNGTAYPYLQVEPKIYRFRILNACNDRMLNLQLYQADPLGHTVTDATGTWGTEVKMVPAAPGAWPPGWPTPDGRAGGFPDPTLMGPSMIQIGTEGGFLPAAATIPNRPVGYDYNRRSITVLNVLEKALFLGPAERADIVVDFTGLAGKTIILYNDAPAPVPAFDPRFDYYTGDVDQTSTGGAPMTQPGYGPNTRTIVQFRVGAAVTTPTTFNAAAIPAAFAASQDKPIVPESAYNAAYAATYTDTWSRIQDTSITFTPAGQTVPLTMPLQPKTIQELFELNYGRMNAILGVELPFTNNQTQTTIPYGYIDPPTELITNSNLATPIGSLGDGTQIWKLTHNGVDTHAIHFHLFNVQLINRVGWDGQVKPPNPNEVGWKETVIMNPLEDIVFALRPTAPTLPFSIPNSIRPLDVTSPIGSTAGFFNVDPNGNPVTVINQLANFGWEYVWHCHLLGHEENDMMRPLAFAFPPIAPTNLLATELSSPLRVILTWTDNSNSETSFRIQRATDAGFTANLATFTVGANVTTYADTTIAQSTVYHYRVIADNVIGSAVPGYSTATASSAPSNPVTVGPLTPSRKDLVGTWDGQGVYFRNMATGTWTGITSPANLIACGDLFGDGFDDLIGIWSGLVWVKNSANGSWIALSTAARDIAAADMNGDGRADFLGTWDGQGVYYKDSVSGAWVQMTSPAEKIAAGDLDGDGKADLIGIWTGQGVWVKYSKTGLWAQLAVTAPRDIAVGDMNGDGRVDFLGTWDGQGVYYKDSVSGAWVQMTSPAEQVTAGDLDADGTDDVIGVWTGQGLWVKFSSTGNWAHITSSARDIAAGKMSGGVWFAGAGMAKSLASPSGGYVEAPGVGSSQDLSFNAPGGRDFTYRTEKNLMPRESGSGVLRIPGPGEPGFRCIRQGNLIPQEGSNREEKKAK